MVIRIVIEFRFSATLLQRKAYFMPIQRDTFLWLLYTVEQMSVKLTAIDLHITLLGYFKFFSDIG